MSSISERSRDADNTSSDAGSSNVGSQSTDELSIVLSQTEIWLRHAELLQSLLGSGIAASLDDIADKESSERLRDRLIVDEQCSMAVYTCKKCRVRCIPGFEHFCCPSNDIYVCVCIYIFLNCGASFRLMFFLCGMHGVML